MIPYLHPDAYSTIVLGTVRSPGVVTLAGHDREQSWDIAEAKDQQGASTKLNGAPIGQFQASFYLAADGSDDEGTDDFARWDAFQRLIESTTAGPTPVALPIYHPDLARNGFTEVVSGGVGGMVHDGRGGATVQVKFLEYRPPKPKPVKRAAPKPGASTANAGARTGVVKPDPNKRAKDELAALLEEARTP